MTKLTIATVQTSPVFGDVPANLDTALGYVPTGVDLAVLPELFATGYQFRDRDELMDFAEPRDGAIVGRLRDHAAATGTTLCAGWAEREGDEIYNSSALVRPTGQWRCTARSICSGTRS